MPLGVGHTVDLVARARASADAPVVVDIRASRAFTLDVTTPGKQARSFAVCPGVSTLTID
jgi:hypothetical protein